MESYKVMLNGPAPWGFRLQGGKDFSMPLSISRLTPGGKAAQAGVGVGDWVLYIDGESTSSMTHIEAQNRIRACGDRLCLTLSRALCPVPSPGIAAPCSEPGSPWMGPRALLGWMRLSLAAGPHLRAMGHRQLAVAPLGQVLHPWGTSIPAVARSIPAPARLSPLLQSPEPPGEAAEARPFGAGSPPNPRPGLVTKPVTYAPLAPACTPQHNGYVAVHPAPRGSGGARCPALLRLACQAPVGGSGRQCPRRGPPMAGAEVAQQDCRTTPVCDPVKLRLIEDAEDWQPRTGTSQSRSFHKLARLTGTDGMEDREDELVKKPREVGLPGDAAGPAPGAGRGLLRDQEHRPGDLRVRAAPRTPAATPGPASRPPWAVDPSFAERYAPDKTSTVVSKHSQPATPTPMQNRSSIVQAAQQAPEGPGRTPLCYKCNKVIRGRYLVALGHYYHPEEFTCCQCRKVLDEGGFFEEKGSIFCPKCYDTRYAPSCAKCKKKITGEVMHALKMTWHVQCFTCAACKTPIRNRAFYMEEGQPYCERDYEKMFGTKCRGCDFKIDAGDRFLEALGFSWHDTCFVCAICQTNLEGKTFYSKKDKPLCKSHAFS
ncbi:PDZ and LIM domain protein 7, partial [Nipponia nippon]